MKIGKSTLFVLFYILFVLCFSVFSYSQIDLNLTLWSNKYYQTVQQLLINLGYFNRPLSSAIYLALILLQFSFFRILLNITKDKKVFSKKTLVLLISFNIILAFIAYPAFSHDFFNYLFDARIVTKYHLNPYQFKALDFPGDLWTRFMHWTHRTYPYGPLWLIVTLPFSFMGFGKFVLTVTLFKLMFVIFYLLNTFIVWKLSKIILKKFSWQPVILYAFNPLIIIESLVSPHNENVMLFFFLYSCYLLFVFKNRFLAGLSLFSSIGVKFITIVLMPLFFVKEIISNSLIFLKISLILLFVPFILEVNYREAYPWYFIPLIGVTALINSAFLNKLVFYVSLGALLRYLPYFYMGSYQKEGVMQMNILLLLPVLLFLAGSFCINFTKNLKYKILKL